MSIHGWLERSIGDAFVTPPPTGLSIDGWFPGLSAIIVRRQGPAVGIAPVKATSILGDALLS